MTTQHTPGPWTTDVHQARETWIMTANPTPWKPPVFVASVPNDADAHLIAAAPDLLAALEALFDDEAFDPREGSLGRMTRLEGMARAAIAKARGRA